MVRGLPTWGGEQRSHHPRFGRLSEDACRMSPASPLPAEDGWMDGGENTPAPASSLHPCLLTICGSPCLSLEPPAITPGPSNLTLTARTPTSLPCEASGSPKPRVVWRKDGQKLDFRLQQGAYRYGAGPRGGTMRCSGWGRWCPFHSGEPGQKPGREAFGSSTKPAPRSVSRPRGSRTIFTPRCPTGGLIPL